MDERGAGATIAGLLARSTAALRPSSETARLDAEVLLAEVLGVDRARLILDHEAEVEVETRTRFERLVSRRASGEPVAYLIGRRPFRALELRVDDRVLIPRPETEGLIEAAVELLPNGAAVLDVGTGSGAIALALAAERPDLVVRGADVSAEAVAVAARNRDELGLDVSFSVGDLLDGALPADAVLANLPYVERDAELPVDV
ncbi:MAG TPA: HemK family protein methyltransferase, partial [Solirubrobacteraceae bacterium]|nr:HemK family protein methyltransferase [Solirubrobacteraceae bacterium]